MSTDRELLELAAKAAKIPIGWHRWPSTAREAAYVPNGDFSEQHGVCYLPWNPLTDDGDALRLAVTLSLDIEFFCDLLVYGGDRDVAEEVLPDPFAATRRAIVRAAAAIAKAEGGAA